MPVLYACLTEVFRLSASGLLLMRLVADQPIGAYVIPAGHIFGTTTYFEHHDEAVFPRAHDFFPERFLPPAAAGGNASPDPPAVPFSYHQFNGAWCACPGGGSPTHARGLARDPGARLTLRRADRAAQQFQWELAKLLIAVFLSRYKVALVGGGGIPNMVHNCLTMLGRPVGDCSVAYAPREAALS